MNQVFLIGRLTKDVELKYTNTQKAVATFTLAMDRGKGKNGEDRGADFVRVTVFDKQAENCERFLAKGRLVGIMGRLQSGQYQDKDGKTVFTLDVIADRVEFLEWANKEDGVKKYVEEATPVGFEALSEDIPF